MVATALPVDFSGRVAVVTGAARGIGAGIAARLRAAGGRVWLVDVDPAALAARAAELGCETICADVRDGDALRAHARRIHDSDGGLDFLVNSAGLLTTGAFDRTDAAQWQRLIDVNLGGIFHCVQGFVPLMRGGGSIVNIASVSAQRGGGALGNVWYGASKAAVVAATMGLAPYQT
ncbi:MAG TPA: SDR family NAD(P)-dependent oxidoreductase, partial [Burkholderiaceae bacterium]|nr:SDR family NAD(P)-dependent oxidoreductase [Burkholderiaceae bacterium]